jgi:L-fuconolactonase
MKTDPTVTVFGRTRPPNDHWLRRAAPEEALEPELRIIDPHMHFWDRPDHRYLVEDYARDVNESGHDIQAIVSMECGSMYRSRGPEHLMCVGETEFAVGMAAMIDSTQYCRSRAAGIVGYADLTLGRLTQETLEAHVRASNGRFRGVRQSAKWDADPMVRGPGGASRSGLYLDPAFGVGIDLLTRMGLSFDASVFHPQIPEVTALARAHPDANIVLIHSGTPVGHSSYAGCETQVHARWRLDMKALSKCPNVSVKLGGILMHLANFDFTIAPAPPSSKQLTELWRPYIEPIVEFFGASRCMASSNFPVDKAGFSYRTIWNMYKRIMAHCSADEKALIFAGTAARVYKLTD